MDKASRYAVKVACIAGIGNALLNLIHQLNEMDKTQEQKFDWERLFYEGCKGVFVGAIAGYIYGSIVDYENSLEKPINTDAYLQALASKVKLKKSDKKHLLLSEKANILVSVLKNNFADKLNGEPVRIGSTEKGTAIKDKFDIDVCFAFKSKSFSSTREMFENVLGFLVSLKGQYSIADVRDQKKSIGVYIKVGINECRVDIVPYKLTDSKKNSSSGYLFVNDNSFFSDNSSYTKTDIGLLKKSLLTETQKQIVIVLKQWKKRNGLPLSSYLLENLVLDAYRCNYNRISQTFTQQVIMVINHIASYLDVIVIRSVENSNNILTNISEKSKSEIIYACKEVIKKYEYQPNSVLKEFY